MRKKVYSEKTKFLNKILYNENSNTAEVSLFVQWSHSLPTHWRSVNGNLKLILRLRPQLQANS